jgi:hypothetical protein
MKKELQFNKCHTAKKSGVKKTPEYSSYIDLGKHIDF